MIKLNIKLFLITSIFCVQLPLNVFAMDDYERKKMGLKSRQEVKESLPQHVKDFVKEVKNSPPPQNIPVVIPKPNTIVNITTGEVSYLPPLKYQ